MSNLHEHLFAQLERLGNGALKGDALEEEINRSKAVTSVASQIINNGNLVLRATIAANDSLRADAQIPEMLLSAPAKKK